MHRVHLRKYIHRTYAVTRILDDINAFSAFFARLSTKAYVICEGLAANRGSIEMAFLKFINDPISLRYFLPLSRANLSVLRFAPEGLQK